MIVLRICKRIKIIPLWIKGVLLNNTYFTFYDELLIRYMYIILFNNSRENDYICFL